MSTVDLRSSSTFKNHRTILSGIRLSGDSSGLVTKRPVCVQAII